MTTYTTLDGKVLDLGGLDDEQRAYFHRCYAEYGAGLPWEDFIELAGGRANPLVRDTHGRITTAVWQHPLYRAVRDLESRLGIRQGKIAPSPGDDVDRDPLQDRWLTVAEAAEAKGVTVQGLHEAIKRGALVAKPAKPGGTRLVVSENSLAAWRPMVARQLS